MSQVCKRWVPHDHDEQKRRMFTKWMLLLLKKPMTFYRPQLPVVISYSDMIWNRNRNQMVRNTKLCLHQRIFACHHHHEKWCWHSSVLMTSEANYEWYLRCRCTWNSFKEHYSIKETGIFYKRVVSASRQCRATYFTCDDKGASRHRWNTCKHPFYSQDLIPRGFWTFSACKHELWGQEFSVNTKMKQASTLCRMPGNDLLHVYEKWVGHCKNI
jgi:hypothetical protein